MQESRVFKIVYYLLEHEKSTASELAEKFEVSDRELSPSTKHKLLQNATVEHASILV